MPDNLKTGITANTRYETQLSESYRELAEYFTSAKEKNLRSRKAAVIQVVEKPTERSTSPLSCGLRTRAGTIAVLKDAVAERLEVINTKPFQKRPMSRQCGNSRWSEMTI